MVLAAGYTPELVELEVGAFAEKTPQTRMYIAIR